MIQIFILLKFIFANCAIKDEKVSQNCFVNNCAECTPENNTFCLKCNKGYGLRISDGESMGICVKCNSGNCDECYDNYENCSLCKSHYYPENQDNGYTKCIGCNIVCKECEGNSSNCISCADTYFLDENKCTRCSDFLSNCFTCSDKDTCTQCITSYGKVYDDNGKYTGKCKKCSASKCSQCDDNYEKCTYCGPEYGVIYDENGTSTGICGRCKNCTSCPRSTDNCTETSCLKGYAPLYDSNGIFLEKCVLCSENCDICKNSSYCQSCDDGYGPILDENGEKSGQCGKCPDNCINCYKGNQTCNTCQRRYGLDLTKNDGQCYQCADDNCNECIQNKDFCSECKDFYGVVYENGTNTGRCGRCPDFCKECSKKSTICTTCADGFGLYENGQCKKCPLHCLQCEKNASFCSSCNVGYRHAFVNGTKTGECVPCGRFCQECEDKESLACTSCLPGNQLVYNSDYHTRECEPCPTNCKTCESDGCSECNEGYFKKYYSNVCVKCPDNCKCDIDILECKSCTYGFGPVLDKNGNFTGRCKKCPENCDDCSKNYSQCLSCNDFYYLMKKTSDLTNLNIGLCFPCPDHCISCRDLNHCNHCEDGYTVYFGVCLPCPDNCSSCNLNGACERCYAGYGINSQTRKCEKCSEDHCINCGTDYEKCIKCEEKYVIYVKDGKNTSQCIPCVENCATCPENNICPKCDDRSGFILDENGKNTGKCAKCLDGCFICSEDYTKCKQCDDGYTLTDDGKCIYACSAGCSKCSNGKCKECIDGYGLVYENGTKTYRCALCETKNCLLCDYDYEKCISCKKGFRYYDGECIPLPDNCIEQYNEKECTYCRNEYGFASSSIGFQYDQCVKCKDENCLDCNIDHSVCNICKKGYGQARDEFGDLTGICKPCLEHCLTCEYDVNECTSCKDGYGIIRNDQGYSQNGKCEKCMEHCLLCQYNSSECQKCEEKYYFSIEKGKCEPFPANCEVYFDATNVCTSCSNGYGFVFKNGTLLNECQKCPENCDDCTADNTKCTLCKQGYGFIFDQNGDNTGKCGACPENCLLCYTNNTECELCKDKYGMKNNKCYACSEKCTNCLRDSDDCVECEIGFGLIFKKDDVSKDKCIPCIDENCEICSYYNKCTKCKDGFCPDEFVYSSSRGTCIPCSYNTTCNVPRCSKCNYDKPDSCAICEKGYDNKKNKCILKIDVIERPSLEIVQSEINHSKVENGNYDLVLSDHIDILDSQILNVKVTYDYKNTAKNPNKITIDNPNNINIALEIHLEYSEITINTKSGVKNYVDIIPLGPRLKINLNKSIIASIKNARGEIIIESIDQNENIKLNKVYPSSYSFTLIPTSSILIEEVDFNGVQRLGVKSDDSQKVQINNVKVQQNANAAIENATITGKIAFGLASTLYLNGFVNLSSSILDLSFNHSTSLGLDDTALLTGYIKSCPKEIIINEGLIGRYLEKKTLLIASSGDKLNCEEWNSIPINVNLSSTKFSEKYCTETAPYRFYLQEKEAPFTKNEGSGDDDGDNKSGGHSKKGLSAGAIAGIVVACVVVVGLVIFLIVYFRVKNDGGSVLP